MVHSTAARKWARIKHSVASKKSRHVVDKIRCKIVAEDCRTFLRQLPPSSIDCIVTSPPYGDLKDYGSAVQVGYGQKTTSEYLPDLEKVFAELFRVATPGAALWLVLDTLKTNGDTIALPWELSTRARSTGWSFHDFIVWDKGRSLPWSHRGQFRGVCEYILLLGKGRLKTFNLDAVRETADLASYWVKYPERYHPDGKAPSDLWHFQIPTQGSWASSSARRHFCPFPTDLVERMIEISSRKGDVVLDPFAGTGTVPAVASQLERYGLGVEINSKFVKAFDNAGFADFSKQIRSAHYNAFANSTSLRKTIVHLRTLKYPKTLFNELLRKDRLGESAIEDVLGYLLRAPHSSGQKTTRLPKDKFAQIDVEVLAGQGADVKNIRRQAEHVISVPPLSKFGIEAKIRVVPYKTWSNWERAKDAAKKWYLYRSGVFNRFDIRAPLRKLIIELKSEPRRSKYPPILSRIGVSITPAE